MTSTVWTYAAMDGDGNAVTGEVRAGSEGDAVTRLRDLGYRPLSLREPDNGLLSRDFQFDWLSAKVKPAELAGSIRQLAAMLRAGVPMMRGLNVIVEQSRDQLEDAWSAVRTDIESGDALSAALERHPRVFDTVLVSLVRAGEASGTLDQALTQAATALERRAALRRKVRSALAYPIAVLALVGVVILAMSLFVVPVFETVYSDLGGELPLPTVIVLTASGFVRRNILFLIGGVFLARAALRKWKATPKGELALATLILRIPVVGEESGDLTEMLALVGDVYEAEVDTAAESFSSIAEPLLIAFLGVVVGGIVLSLYLPMFRLVDLVQ